jgi:GTP-binding protein EngB required for normal cell division
MQTPWKTFNNAAFAYLCQNGHTSEASATLLSAIGQVLRQYKPVDDPEFAIGRCLQLDARFHIIDLHVPGRTKVFALAAPAPSPRRPVSSGGLELVKHSPAKHAEVAPALNAASGGFASLGASLLSSMFSNVDPSQHLKVVIQNGQGQSISVEKGGSARSREQHCETRQKTPMAPSSAFFSAQETPRAIQAPAAPDVRVCLHGLNCKNGSCSFHHFSPAFYATASASGDRPHLRSALSSDPCRFDSGCKKSDCPQQHSSPAQFKVAYQPIAAPSKQSPAKPCCSPGPSKPAPTVCVTVLMCGETGSGKSTIINGLANLCAKSSMLDRRNIKVAIPTRYLPQSPEFSGTAGSEVGGSGVSSQTQSCATYNMTHETPDLIVRLKVIDSPGFSDTRGMSQDEVNMNKIIDAVSSLPQPLTSLVLVLNGATARHTINVRNMISRVRGNMPDAVLKNLVIVCTNCTPHTCNTDRDAMRAELGLSATDHADFFYIQNSAFSSNPDTWTDDTRREIAKDWKVCSRELQRLLTHLSSKVAVSSGRPVDWQSMRDARMRLKQALHAALLDTQQYRQVLASLDKAELLLQQNSSDVNAFSNYIKRTQQTVTELVDASYHSTICSSCNAVCHNNCGLDEIANRGDNAFRNCAAFSGDNCHAGSCRCSYTTHYHGRKTMRTSTKTLETVLADIKARHDQAVSGRASAASMLATLASSRANVEQSLRALGQRLLKECEDIRRICSGFNILDELYAIRLFHQ